MFPFSPSYPFAIVGINLTHIAYTLLLDGRVKSHFFNAHLDIYCIEDFHQVYCMSLPKKIAIMMLKVVFVSTRLFVFHFRSVVAQSETSRCDGVQPCER